MGMTLTNNVLKRLQQSNPTAHKLLNECWRASMGHELSSLRFDEYMLRGNLRSLITDESADDIQLAIQLIKQKIASS
jgi:hypothetical protein